MKLSCSVQIINRLALEHGQNGALKLLKGVIQLRNIPGGSVQILVCTSKDVTGQRYDVSKIKKLRTSFISNGMMTIEMKEPHVNVMIRNCNPKELQGFHLKLEGFVKTLIPSSYLLRTTDSTGAITSEPAVSANPRQDPTERNVGSSEAPNRGLKRSYEQISISKVELTSIKRSLRMPVHNSVTVFDRKNYPKQFPTEVQSVVLSTIQLRKIDPKLLMLNQLRELILNCNVLTSIEPLRHLKSRLTKLVLSSNEIEIISDDLFNAKPFEELTQLILHNNKLKTLPSSILGLKMLRILDVSRNQLHVLPYNLNKLSRLSTLKVNANLLDFIPYTICSMQLDELDVSDNCFTNLNVAENNQAKVELSNFPSLFELATETVASKSYFGYSMRRKDNISIVPEETPKIVMDYLNACKLCSRCRQPKLRYTIHGLSVPNRLGAQSTTNSPGFMSFVSKKVLCSRCMLL